MLPLAGASPLDDDKPTLKVKAPRMNFMRPTMPNQRQRSSITVRVTAEIENLSKVSPENMEQYYCLEEVWEWDDDTESFYEPDCEPYEEGMELKRFFSSSHQYRWPGNYQVELRLQREGKTVLFGKASVQIRS